MSAPLQWKEVNARLDMGRFTIRTMPTRMEKLGDDPMRAVLTLRPDLGGALGRLATRIDRGPEKGPARRAAEQEIAPPADAISTRGAAK